MSSTIKSSTTPLGKRSPSPPSPPNVPVKDPSITPHLMTSDPPSETDRSTHPTSYPSCPITTHVLNTSSGDPCGALPVRLEFLGPHASNSSASDNAPSAHSWAALTNSNGRITNWKGAEKNQYELHELFEQLSRKGEGWMWRLVFVTDGHLGEKSWWSDVELKFRTDLTTGKDRRTHWHVPLLISEFGMSSYRGS